MEFLAVVYHTLAAFSEMFDIVYFLRKLIFLETDTYSWVKEDDSSLCDFLASDEDIHAETTSTTHENETTDEKRVAETGGDIFQEHPDDQSTDSHQMDNDSDLLIREFTELPAEVDKNASADRCNGHEESPSSSVLGVTDACVASISATTDNVRTESETLTSRMTLEDESATTNRFYTSSWDLVSIVKFLYKLPDIQTSEIPEREEECIPLVHYPIKYHENVVVVDLGSCSVRAGILMDQPTLPSLFFPSVCATHKITGEHVFGMEALSPEVRQNSVISFPLRPSVKITKHSIDVKRVEGIFQKIFQELRVDPSQYKVQVCLPRSLSIGAQNDLVEILLDCLHVHAVSLAHQAIFTMYAHDASTGIVVDIGDRMDILLIIDGFVVESGVTRLPHGGQRLVHHMKHALAQKQISLSNDLDSFVVQYIAENSCFLASDYEEELRSAHSHPQLVRKSVDLQLFAKKDNCLKFATLDEARFSVPEGLFDPDSWGLDSPGVHKLVQKAILAAGLDARKQVAQNIFVSGGVTLTSGFVERLRREMIRLNEPRITPKVHASSHRYHCTFIGACKFSRMDAFHRVCVTREEFNKNHATALKKFVLCI